MATGLESLGLGIRLLFQGDEAVRGLAKHGHELHKMQMGLMQLDMGMQRVTKGISSLVGQFQMLGLAAAGVTAVFVKQAAEFDHAVKMYGVATGETQNFLAQEPKIRAMALSFSNEFGIMGKVAADTMAQIAKAGVEGNAAIEETTRTALRVALIEPSLQAAQTAEYLVDSSNAWKRKAEEVSDIFVRIGAETTTGPAGMFEAMKMSQGLLKEFMSLEEAAAAVGAASSLAGLKGSIAGTTLATFYTTMTKIQSKKMQASFGLKFSDESGNWKKTADIIREVARAEQEFGMTEVQRAEFENKLFGQRGQRIMGLRSKLSLLNDLETKATESQGYTMRAADLAMTSLQKQWDLTKVAIVNTGVQFVDRFRTPMIDGLTEIKQFVTDVGASLEGLLSGKSLEDVMKTGVGGKAAAFSQGLVDGFRQAVEWVNRFRGSLEGVGAVLDAHTVGQVLALGIAAGGVAIVLGPIVRVASALLSIFTGLGFIGWGVVKMFSAVRATWTATIGPWITAMMEAVGGLWGLTGVFAQAWAIVNIGIGMLSVLWDDIATMFGEFFGMLGAFGAMMDDIFGRPLRAIGALLGTFLQPIVEGIGQAFDLFRSAFRDFGNAFIEGLKFFGLDLGLTKDDLGAFRDMINSFTDWLAEVLDNLDFLGLGSDRNQRQLRGGDDINWQKDRGSNPRGGGLIGPAPAAPQTGMNNYYDMRSDIAANDAATRPGGGVIAFSVQSDLVLDNKKVAGAGARHEVEISERAGAKVTAWQRRMVHERSALGTARA